jgi:hypothetical protein
MDRGSFPVPRSLLICNSRNILRKFLGWQVDAELSRHACQFKLENVSRAGSVQWKKNSLLELRHYQPSQKSLNRLK